MIGTDELDARRALVERDPGLPALATIIDPDALAERIGEPVSVHRLRYKPATSVHAAVTAGDRWCLVAGYGPGGTPKLDSQRAAAARRGAPLIVDDRQGRWLIVPADADRTLPFRALAGPDDDATIRAYNPHRRIVRIAPSVGGWVAKIHARDRQPVSTGLADALTACGVRTPASLPARHPQVRRTVFQPGRPADPAADADAVGAAVAALGASRPDVTLRRWTAADLVGRARAALSLVTTVLPDLTDLASGMLAACRCRAGEIARLPSVVVHGDLSADQVVIDDGGPWLVDLDDCSRGPLGWDQASWVAAQVARGSGAPVPLPGPLPHPALQAVALAVRSPEPFARQRPGWVALTRTTLAAAAALIDERDARSRCLDL